MVAISQFSHTYCTLKLHVIHMETKELNQLRLQPITCIIVTHYWFSKYMVVDVYVYVLLEPY